MTLKLEEAVNTPNDRVPGVDWVILLKVNWVIYCNHSLLRGGFLPINSLNREQWMSIARVKISYIPNISKLSDNMRVNAGSKIKVTQGTLVTVRGTSAGWDCFGKVTQEMMSFSKCSHFCQMYGLHLGSESLTISYTDFSQSVSHSQSCVPCKVSVLQTWHSSHSSLRCTNGTSQKDRKTVNQDDIPFSCTLYCR